MVVPLTATQGDQLTPSLDVRVLMNRLVEAGRLVMVVSVSQVTLWPPSSAHEVYSPLAAYAPARTQSTRIGLRPPPIVLGS
jgi:hypothetical protein